MLREAVKRMGRRFRARRSVGTERGASLVEYALLLALVAVVAAGSLAYLGKAVNHTLSSVAAQIAGDDLQIYPEDVNGSNMCPSSPCTITATGQTTVKFTTAGATGDVTYSYPDNLGDLLDFVVDGDVLDMQVYGHPSPPIPITLEATDSSGGTGVLQLSLVVD